MICFSENDQTSGDFKKPEQSDTKKEGGADRKLTMKTLSKTVSKLSPKAQRRKEKSPSNVAKLQVGIALNGSLISCLVATDGF